MAEKSNDIFDFGEDEAVPRPREEVKTDVPSTFKSNILAQSLNEIPMCDMGSLKLIKFKCVATENYNAGSLFSLCRVPAARVRILGALSNFEFNLNGSKNCNGDLGWTKHRTRHREVIPFNPEGFNELLDVNGLQTIMMDSMEGMFLVLTTHGPGEEGDFVEGYIVYVKL